MVKKPSTHKKRPVGRPPKDPEDLRSVRFSFRMHPDLYGEMIRQARIAGQPLSVWCERACIARLHNDTGKVLLDPIGRYLPPLTAEHGLYNDRWHQNPPPKTQAPPKSK